MSLGLYAFSGLFVGFLIGMTGVGGGSLMTPLLILLFGIHPGTAVGSDLLYASVTKVVGAGVHGRHGSVDWGVTRRLACGSIPAVAATLLALAAWPGIRMDSRLVTLILAGVLMLTTPLLLFRAPLLRLAAAPLDRLSHGQVAGLTVVTGVVLGCLVTLTSVGSGAIGMTALLMLYPRLPVVRLVGSDIAHAVPLTLLAGFGHWLLGDVNLTLVGSLLMGSTPGVVLGSLVSFRSPEPVLRVVLATVLFVAGTQLLR